MPPKRTKRPVEPGEKFNKKIHIERRVNPPSTLRTEYYEYYSDKPVTEKQRAVGLTKQRLTLALRRGHFLKGVLPEQSGHINNPKTGKYMGPEIIDRRSKIHNYKRKPQKKPK